MEPFCASCCATAKKLLMLMLLIPCLVVCYAQNLQKSSPMGEVADRIAIKDLIDAYAHYADRREAEKQSALFTVDGEIEVFQGEPGKNKSTAIIKGRKDLIAGFKTLKKYDVTMHFNGQSTIQLYGDSAKGETYCLAHHLWLEKGHRMLMVMGIRYYDKFLRVNGNWFFSKRQLIFDWIDRRPSHP